MKENIEKLMLMGFAIIAISFLIISSAKAQTSNPVAYRAVHYIMDVEKLRDAVQQMGERDIPETPEKDILNRKKVQGVNATIYISNVTPTFKSVSATSIFL